ncbi:Tyrosine-protein kinase, partial [Trema orientale]
VGDPIGPSSCASSTSVSCWLCRKACPMSLKALLSVACRKSPARGGPLLSCWLTYSSIKIRNLIF